jgi:hypothetical protein
LGVHADTKRKPGSPGTPIHPPGTWWYGRRVGCLQPSLPQARSLAVARYHPSPWWYLCPCSFLDGPWLSSHAWSGPYGHPRVRSQPLLPSAPRLQKGGRQSRCNAQVQGSAIAQGFWVLPPEKLWVGITSSALALTSHPSDHTKPPSITSYHTQSPSIISPPCTPVNMANPEMLKQK